MWKPVDQLTTSDFDQSKIWEWRENSDRAEVRQTELRELTEYNFDPVYIAATKFIFPNGEIEYGYCSPGDASGLDYTQPVIITGKGHIPLWSERPLTREVISKYCEWLNIEMASLLPIKIECLVPVDKYCYREVINAL